MIYIIIILKIKNKNFIFKFTQIHLFTLSQIHHLKETHLHVLKLSTCDFVTKANDVLFKIRSRNKFGREKLSYLD